MADSHSTLATLAEGPQGWVHTLTDEQHNEIHETLIVATDALAAIIEHENNPGPTRAVVKLVHDLLLKLETQFEEAAIARP